MNTPTKNPLHTQRAFLLIGSPKGKAGSSYALGGYLVRKLVAGGMDVEEMTVSAALQSTEYLHRMHKAMDAADLVIVAFPLYVDQLPAPLIQLLELVADRRKGSPGVAPAAGPLVQKLAVIVQCGFPEARQNDPAVDIMRQFAREAGFEWAGALALGMGGAVGRKPLEKAGGMVRNVVRALDRAAASFSAGGGVPDEATAMMARPLMPRWLYLPAANWSFKRELKKHGAGKRAYDRPYA
jgi:hypothetical protein